MRALLALGNRYRSEPRTSDNLRSLCRGGNAIQGEIALPSSRRDNGKLASQEVAGSTHNQVMRPARDAGAVTIENYGRANFFTLLNSRGSSVKEDGGASRKINANAFKFDAEIN